MAVKPPYLPTSNSSLSIQKKFDEFMDSLPPCEVYVKGDSGAIIGTGIKYLPDGSILAPEGFGVNSGSVNFGDLITLSESAGYLSISNHLENKHYQMVDYWVPTDRPSADPTYFKLIEAEYRFDAQTDQSSTLTSNPLTFTYTTQLDARTNRLILNASSAMKNVKIKITKSDSGVSLKYLPSKSSWVSIGGGYDFVIGENVIDFSDSPLPLTAGTMLTFEIKADNVSLKGSPSGKPVISSYVQRGKFVTLASSDTITPGYIKQQLVSLSSPNKLPKTAIQDAVFSVNGQYGDVNITTNSISAQEKSKKLSQISDLVVLPNSLLYTDSSGTVENVAATNYAINLLRAETDEQTRSGLGLGSSAVLDINVPNGIPQLNEAGKLPQSIMELALPAVAYSGKYSDLSEKPTIPPAQVQSDWAATSGVAQVLNKPAIPSTTAQIAEATNLYYTDARVQSYLTANGYRKVETLQGTTNTAGVYQVTFANTYAAVPHVNPVVINGTPAQVVTISNLSATGCTLTVQQRNSVTLLATELLLAATVPVPGATVGVLVFPKA